MKSLKNKNLIFMGLLFAAALIMSPANAWAYPNAGFYELSYTGEIDTTPAPVIRFLDPSSAYAGSSGRTIEIIGDNFQPGAVARWNGGARYTEYKGPSRLTMTLDEYDFRTVSKNVVTVKNPDGKISNPATFSVLAKPAPSAPAAVTKPATVTKTVAKKPVATTVKKAPVAKAVTKCPEPETTQANVVASNTNNLGNGGTDNANNYSPLAASAASANKSFVPNTLIGWLTLFILIMLAVIVFRKLWVTEAERNTSLKHA